MWNSCVSQLFIFQIIFSAANQFQSVSAVKAGPGTNCPSARVYAKKPASGCAKPSDPNKLPPSKLEKWFTKENFKACCSPNKVYSAEANYRRDLAAFFAHAIQETGENDASLYNGKLTNDQAADCFYRGGFFNWFEGGPVSAFLNPAAPGYSPKDGDVCNSNGRYCDRSKIADFFWPCGNDTAGGYFKNCYFGRGAIQISYNYNYGQFNNFLKSKNINVDLLKEPNLVMTKMNPPLAIMASLWFYMTPQPPKPSMHDIVLGDWNSGDANKAAGYSGPIFGPTSLIINNECGGEDKAEPGGAGESRRIKAFKWFCSYFKVEPGPDNTLSCKNMAVRLNSMGYPVSYAPEWSTTWKEQPCNCMPVTYEGPVPYYDPKYYPKKWSDQNEANRKRCIEIICKKPIIFDMDSSTSKCINYCSKRM
uniref:Glyco_hydro_19_cat domain-containing protein n=5 Tax=Heterorhabditis TaxID=37861 RepID=A0A1I7XTZ7_HETBA